MSPSLSGQSALRFATLEEAKKACVADEAATGVVYVPSEAASEAAVPPVTSGSKRKQKETQPGADDWNALKDAVEEKLELQTVDDEAVSKRVQQLLDKKYAAKGGLVAAITADETVLDRLPMERKAAFGQAMSEQETDLSKALEAAKAAMAALAEANAKAVAPKKSLAKKMK